MNEVYEVYGIQKTLYYAYSNIIITTINLTSMNNDHIIFYLSIK